MSICPHGHIGVYSVSPNTQCGRPLRVPDAPLVWPDAYCGRHVFLPVDGGISAQLRLPPNPGLTCVVPPSRHASYLAHLGLIRHLEVRLAIV